MESSFTYCSQWVIADCFFLTLVMSSTDVIISCILTNWAGKKRKNSQKYNTVLMSRIFLEKNEPLWVWFLGHEEKWGINSKLGALSSLTCSTYTKIGTIQRRLAWPLRKDDTQIREAFHIFQTSLKFFFLLWEMCAEMGVEKERFPKWWRFYYGGRKSRYSAGFDGKTNPENFCLNEIVRQAAPVA